MSRTLSYESTSHDLASFLTEHRKDILAEWEAAIRKMPVADRLSGPALIDHVPRLLERIAVAVSEIGSGRKTSPAPLDDAEIHALARLEEGFDLGQVVTEYSVLRACILRHWESRFGNVHPEGGMRILNQAIDMAVAASVERFTQARDRTLQSIDRIAGAALESRSLDDLLRRLLTVFVETTASVDTAAIFIREGDRFRLRASLGFDEDVAQRFSLALHEGVVGRIAALRAPVSLENASQDPTVVMPALRRMQVRAFYGVPLVDDGHVLGVAWMGSLTAHVFSQQDRRLFSTMATRASIAIEHHLLREEAEERARRERAAREETERTSALLDALFSASSLGMAFIDRDFRYLRINEGLARMNGLPAEAHIGKSVREVLGEHAPMVESLLRRILETGESLKNFEIELPDSRWFYANYFPVRSTSGSIMGIGAVVSDVTDRKQTHLEAQRRAAELAAVIENLPAAVFIGTKERGVEQGNRQAIELLGATGRRAGGPIPPLVESLRPLDAYTREPLTAEENPFAIALTGKTTERDMLVHDVRKGEDLVLRVSGAPILLDGMIIGAISVATDITDRKRFEAALRQTEERLRIVMGAAPALISFITPDHRYEYVNQEYEHWFGERTSDVCGRHLRDVLGDEAYERVRPFLERAFSSGESLQYEMEMQYKTGPRFVHASYVPHRDEAGRVDGVVALVSDVTARRQVEHELRRSRDQLHVILGGVSEGIFAMDAKAELLFANEAAARMMGFDTVQDLMRATPAERDRFVPFDETGRPLPPEEWPPMVALRTGEPAEATIQYRVKKTDELRWGLSCATPVKDEYGNVRMVVIFWRDLTAARRGTEQQAFLAHASKILAESLDFEKTLAEVAKLAVPSIADWCVVDIVKGSGEPAPNRLVAAHVDPEKVQWANELRRRYPPDWSAPRGVGQVVRTGQSEMMREVPDDLLVASAKDDEHLRLLREVGLRSYMVVPLRGRKGTLGAMSFVAAESGRLYDEQDLAFAEELARRAAVAIEHAGLFAEAKAANRHKDEFLAMLAHELRNPLAPLMHGTALLRLPGHDSSKVVDVIDRQVRHLARMVDDLLEVSRITRGKITLRQERLDIVRTMSEILLERSEAARSASLLVDASLPDHAIWVSADRTRIAQVLTNLLANSIKFTERGGRIHVSVHDLPAEREVEIRIRDTGIGIDRDLLPRIFDPFTQSDRSLDRSGGGLGLGLAVVKALIALHGGTVGAHSEGLGKGSTFWVRLPTIAAPAQAAPAPGERTAPDRRRLLVIEDNRDAAEMLREVLRHRGHQVEALFSGDRALEVLRSFQPDVVLCDLGLPSKDGFVVAREIRADPAGRATKLVALSGYGMAEDRERAIAAGFDRHLTKPVDVDQLERVIQELTGSRSS